MILLNLTLKLIALDNIFIFNLMLKNLFYDTCWNIFTLAINYYNNI